MARVEIRGVRKSYAGVEVIHGVDIAIADGDFAVVVGPSGCGKSTLLRMIAGLEPITAGEVAIGGRVVNALEPKARNIAMVFQNYALYPHMSVYDNMAYGLRNLRTPKAEVDARVRRAARILQLSELLPRKPRQLSGGQRQRVAMGRAIVRQPDVFLFDEPLSNLDAKLRVQMRLEIKKLHKELGATSVYVTHDQTEAMTMADVLVVMNGGVAEQVGTPMEVYRRPASVFVAGFIGSPAMNFLSGRIAADGRHAELDGGLSLPLNAAAEASRPVTLGVRPEHLAVANGAATARLHVDMVEPLGADTLVHGRLDGEAATTMRLTGERAPQPGEALPVTLPAAALHLFDPDSGRRLLP